MQNGEPAPLRPSDVAPVTDADIAHILEGHAADSPVTNKYKFPPGWPVRVAVEAALWSRSVRRTLLPGERPQSVDLRALYDDVIFLVALRRFRTSWEVQTAHPISGTGVAYLDKRGRRHAAPLIIADLDG
jgi:hypothetical protein